MVDSFLVFVWIMPVTVTAWPLFYLGLFLDFMVMIHGSDALPTLSIWLQRCATGLKFRDK
jgi:hypothetical protein